MSARERISVRKDGIYCKASLTYGKSFSLGSHLGTDTENMIIDNTKEEILVFALIDIIDEFSTREPELTMFGYGLRTIPIKDNIIICPPFVPTKNRQYV